MYFSWKNSHWNWVFVKKDGRATTNIFCFEPKVCFEIYHMHHSTLKQYQISKQTEVGYSKFNSKQNKKVFVNILTMHDWWRNNKIFKGNSWDLEFFHYYSKWLGLDNSRHSEIVCLLEFPAENLLYSTDLYVLRWRAIRPGAVW